MVVLPTPPLTGITDVAVVSLLLPEEVGLVAGVVEAEGVVFAFDKAGVLEAAGIGANDPTPVPLADGRAVA